MDNFNIVISDTPYEMIIRQDSSTLIDSVFFIRTSIGSFPCQDWTDFSLALLSQWCDNLLKMPTGKNAKCTLPFMDGPYWLDVELHGDVYVFQGRWDKEGCQPDFQESFIFHCSPDVFFSKLLRAFRQIIKILHQKQADEIVQNEAKQIYQHYKNLIEKHMESTTCAQEKTFHGVSGEIQETSGTGVEER